MTASTEPTPAIHTIPRTRDAMAMPLVFLLGGTPPYPNGAGEYGKGAGAGGGCNEGRGMGAVEDTGVVWAVSGGKSGGEAELGTQWSGCCSGEYHLPSEASHHPGPCDESLILLPSDVWGSAVQPRPEPSRIPAHRITTWRDGTCGAPGPA